MAFSERKCLTSGKILYEVCRDQKRKRHHILYKHSLCIHLTLWNLHSARSVPVSANLLWMTFFVYSPPFLTAGLLGSGVLRGALQSGVEWHSLPPQGPRNQHPPAELPHHREVPTPPWPGWQHERRLACFPRNDLRKIRVCSELIGDSLKHQRGQSELNG